MDRPVPQHIVISAVNIRKGGTLTVLKDCLRYLSTRKDLRVTALVHDGTLCYFPGIEYKEIPWSTKSWFHRLWCEYFTMHRISCELPAVDLWFSLHDTTPHVKARRQAVYCHTSFPFLKTSWQDVKMDYKIPLFSLLTRYAYRIGVRRNRYLVVQSEWMREGLSQLIHFHKERIIVAPPAFSAPQIIDTAATETQTLFFYPSTPDCHKNFETICYAARILAYQSNRYNFKLVLTIRGDENRYARWLKSMFGWESFIDFHGFMSKEELYAYYGKAACLVFPSRVETWGLPISEFLTSGKPMILADLPYAHEAAAGAANVAFASNNPSDYFRKMEELLQGDMHSYHSVPSPHIHKPLTKGWDELFSTLLKDL